MPGTNDATAPTATSATGADQPTRPDRPVTVTVTRTKETIQMMAVTMSMSAIPSSRVRCGIRHHATAAHRARLAGRLGRASTARNAFVTKDRSSIVVSSRRCRRKGT